MYRIAYLIGRLWKAMRLGFRDGYGAPTKRQTDDRIARVRGALLNSDSIVPAVKLHRELFGTSLKDAKDAVEAIRTAPY